MPANVQVLLRRYDRLMAEHMLFRNTWQEISDQTRPTQSQFSTQRSPGQKQTEKLFDSTAIDANERLAATLAGTLTSRATKWFGLKVRSEELDEDDSVKQWLEDCSKYMYRAFNQSSFESESHEVYLDVGAFGTAALFEEERRPESRQFNGLIFRALPLSNVAIDEDSEGRVNTVFRDFSMSAWAAVDKFGAENVGDRINKAIEDNKPELPFKFFQAVYPRLGGNSQPGAYAQDLPFASCYVSLVDKHIILESGFHEFPFMVPRWTKSPGERYGRGPGHIALPDVRVLNEIKRQGLLAGGKAINPPTQSEDDGVIGPIANRSGGNTIVKNVDRGVRPLFPIGMLSEAIRNENLKSSDLREQILNVFHDDLTKLPVGPAMTAFEVAKRIELMQRKLGPVVGRLETEFLNPLIERTFGIMFRRGAFPPAPAILAGHFIDVQYEGPLAKSQRLSEVEGIDQFVQSLVTQAQLDPSVLDVYDFSEGARISADIRGVPAKTMRSRDDVDKLRQDRAAKNAEMQQKADLERAAGAAGKAAPALKLLQGGTGGTNATI